MAVVYEKKEILVVEEGDGFLVQLAENNDLIFWEQVDTRFVGLSDGEVKEAHEREIHPTEDTLMVQHGTGFTQLYRKVMRVEVIPQYQAAFLRSMLPNVAA
jgi:hypothetical protein